MSTLGLLVPPRLASCLCFFARDKEPCLSHKQHSLASSRSNRKIYTLTKHIRKFRQNIINICNCQQEFGTPFIQKKWHKQIKHKKYKMHKKNFQNYVLVLGVSSTKGGFIKFGNMFWSEERDMPLWRWMICTHFLQFQPLLPPILLQCLCTL